MCRAYHGFYLCRVRGNDILLYQCGTMLSSCNNFLSPSFENSLQSVSAVRMFRSSEAPSRRLMSSPCHFWVLDCAYISDTKKRVMRSAIEMNRAYLLTPGRIAAFKKGGGRNAAQILCVVTEVNKECVKESVLEILFAVGGVSVIIRISPWAGHVQHCYLVARFGSGISNIFCGWTQEPLASGRDVPQCLSQVLKLLPGANGFDQCCFACFVTMFVFLDRCVVVQVVGDDEVWEVSSCLWASGSVAMSLCRLPLWRLANYTDGRLRRGHPIGAC